jgi:CheY-like chemotaxis protein
MELVWVTLIFFVFLLIVGGALLWRFPEEVRSLVRRTAAIKVSREGIAWQIFEEAVEQKEGRKPAAAQIRPLLRALPSGRLLWVDDAPANNRLEVQALREMGVEIDTAVSNEEAAAYAGSRSYDLVISDIGRSSPLEDDRAGLMLPSLLRAAGSEVAVIYYVGRAELPETDSGEPVFDAPSKLLAHIEEALSGASKGARPPI